jgi:DHA2 family multidrug resistance protein-like MFS transporter
MSERKLPGFLAEVVDDKPAFRTLGAAALALLAAGLNPMVTSPFISDVQAAIRERPQLESLAALLGVLGAATLLAGGVAGDAYRSRRILQAGLVTLAVTSAANLIFTDGPLFIAGRFVGALAVGAVVPFAIAAVATVYSGVPRATAIGFAYAGWGLGTALPPILLTITGPGGSDFLAYLAALIPAIAAAYVAPRAISDLPGTSAPRVGVVARIAIWAFGIIAVAGGLAAFGSGLNAVRLATIGLGIAALALAGLLEWLARRRQVPVPIRLRPVLVVLMAGLFVGVAQSVPMTLLPVFFQVIVGLGPIFSVAAIMPIIVALVVAGPLAGWLLPRSSPRMLIGGGLVAVGVGDLILGVVASRGVSYLLFLLPFLLVGAGFVIATTVRTAVIFASVPRDLPASAAALNEASVGLGSRIGVAVAAVILTQVTLSAYAAGLPPGTDQTVALAPLQDILVALGTPNFSSVVGSADPSLLSGYANAYIEGIRVVHLATGAVAVVAGLVAWIALGRHDPLQTMWGDDAAA